MTQHPTSAERPSTDATDEVVAAVLAASRILLGVSARSLAGVEERVTLTQFRALAALSDAPDSNLHGLADDLGVTPSTALRTVDRLVAAGLAERRDNADDRREVVLTPTREGRRVVRVVTARRRQAVDDILARMPARQRRDLVPVFHAFADAADGPGGPTGTARARGG